VQTQTQCQHTLFSYAYFISSFVYNSYNLHVDIDLRDYVFVLVCMLIYTCTLLCLSVIIIINLLAQKISPRINQYLSVLLFTLFFILLLHCCLN